MAPVSFFYIEPRPAKRLGSRRRKRRTVQSNPRANTGRGATSRMDMTWVTDRIAVGGGIWNDEKMIEVVRTGVTHIVDMQIEFDDTKLAQPYGIDVLWNP